MAAQTITVTATGTRTVQPEQAMVEVVVTTGEATAANALAGAQEQADAVRTAVGELGVDETEAIEVSVRPTDEMFDTDIDAPFVGTVRVQIGCAAVAVTTVVEAAADLGASVRSTDFQISAAKRKALLDDALEDAVSRAREKAIRGAAAEDVAVGDVIDITEVRDHSEPEGLNEQTFGTDTDPNTTPRTIQLSEEVEVTFVITADGQ